jgi:ABC-type Zn uptake system ZnuABC Zn-binding protein ZnuA
MFSSLFLTLLPVLAIFGSLLSACSAIPKTSGEKLTVVATTTFIGDVTTQVGGDLVDVSVMMPVGVDPHSFEPAPADIGKVAEADLVLINGIEFESFLEKLIENAGDESKVIVVSDGIELLAFEGDEHADEGEEHGEFDPHVWNDPNNVIVWTNNIAAVLSDHDPDNAVAYRTHADIYITELQALDTWIQEQLAQIPEANRQFVTEHGTMNYFAARYGFEVVGAVIPGFSTLAQTSAQELAELENQIRSLGVKAILVGNTVNPNLANQIAQDTGIQLVPIFSDSLSTPDGPAPTYLDFMRVNVDAIVEGLK